MTATIAAGARPLLSAALFAATLIAALDSPPLAAQSSSPADSLGVDPDVRVGTLANGLRYYIRANDEPADRAELRLALDAGSILETEAQLGVAHFVEHMAFNGTRNFEEQALIDYLESVGMRFGADLNASTSFDETIYMLTVPTDSAGVMETGIRILADWAGGVTFDAAQVLAERPVVLEEWRGRLGAGSRLQERQLPVLFHGSRYAERLPIGDTAVLARVDSAGLRAFYDAWYRPDLMAVVAVGDFDPARIEVLIRDAFGGLAAPAAPASRVVYGMPPHDSTLVALATDPEATSTSISIYHKRTAAEQGTAAAYRQRIVERLYTGMLNQRLDERTQSATPPFITGFAGNFGIARTSEAFVLSALVRSGGVLEGAEALLVEAERAARHGFGAAELERQKADVLRAMERAHAERENTESRRFADEYVRAFLEDEPIPGIEAEYALYRELLPGITLREVEAVGERFMRGASRVVLGSAPAGAPDALPEEAELRALLGDVARRDIEPYEDLVAGAELMPREPEPGRIVEERRLDGVDATAWRLDNGVRVVLKPTDFKADQVLFHAFSPGGASLVPDDEYIVAATTIPVVTAGGLGEHDRVALEKLLAGKAVQVQPGLGETEEALAGSASPADLETLFQLIHLYVTAPRADTVAFVSFRDRMRAALENRGRSPDAAFQDTVQVTLTQHHPRARPLSDAWFDRMDLDRSLEIYRDRFADAGDFTFVFVGSFQLDAMRPLVERYLASLPASGREESWRDTGVDPPSGVIEKTVRRGLEPKARTQITFAGSTAYDEDDALALALVAEVLRLRLRDVLREELGGTYGVGVSASMDRRPDDEYAFTITFGSAPERLDELAAAVFDEIRALKETGPTAAELAKVHEAELREWQTGLEENGYWLGSLVHAERWGLDHARILRYDRRVRDVGAEEIREAAREFLREDRYVRVSLRPETEPAS